MLFFVITPILVLFYFFNAFQMNFFKDDFFFLKISHIHSFSDFLNLFSPIRTYSYKPLASEVFYFFIRNNVLIGRLVVFLTYFVGLYFLYRSIQFISKNPLFSKITVLLYSVSFIHVFQLYWLATFQEVLVFATLTTSFYLFLQKKYFPSVLLYIVALLSKETAILYVIFLLLINVFLNIKNSKKIKIDFKKIIYPLISYIICSVIFYIVYQYSLKFVTILDNYKMEFDLKRIINNSFWYFLWAWGLPNFLSDYMKSIFFKFTPDFWKLFKDKAFLNYLYTYASYLILFFSSLIIFMLLNLKKIKNILFMAVFSFASFFIFLGPILFFPHRWMVRLTIPLVFVSLFQAYVFVSFLKNKSFFKVLSIFLITLYLLGNYFGTKLHESSSLYLLESRFVTNADQIFKKEKESIEKHSIIYFLDYGFDKKGKKVYLIPWGGSRKLENTFHGQYFLDYYFPKKNIKAVYGYTTEKIPKDAYVIHSFKFLK